VINAIELWTRRHEEKPVETGENARAARWRCTLVAAAKSCAPLGVRFRSDVGHTGRDTDELIQDAAPFRGAISALPTASYRYEVISFRFLNAPEITDSPAPAAPPRVAYRLAI
jgi:hypothetical protein